MTTKINKMIDRVVRCVKCDMPIGKCSCWEKNVLAAGLKSAVKSAEIVGR